MLWQTSPKIQSFPNAILHVDGDAFFASCEQAIHPEWKGKPVVTGKERGIASAASYPAKQRGVRRGMILSEVKKVCPEAIIVPGDYETYSLFSKRMFNILRRFSNIVEEYGIDEAFVNLTGLRRPMQMSYSKMAQEIKSSIERELDITVSVGLAPTKVLAKVASKWQKPNGFITIPGRDIQKFLKQLPVGYVWGIGKNTAEHLHQFGIQTAYDFMSKPKEFIQKICTKPHQEIWHELNGDMIYDVITEQKTTYASISKTKTFTPPSTEEQFIFSQLIKNLENACMKARRYTLVADTMVILLKEQNFHMHALELKLTRASAYPHELVTLVKSLFYKLFIPGRLYRSTGIILGGLKENTRIQSSLFESPVALQKLQRVYHAMDTLSASFGKHTVHLGGSLEANVFQQHAGEPAQGGRSTRLNIPLLFGIVK